MQASRDDIRGSDTGLGLGNTREASTVLVSLDFETYYDADYTLRKLSTSEYVRDDRFEALSVAIKIDTGKTQCYFGPDISKALDAIDWSKAKLLCHHTHFDGLILSHWFGHVPAYYMDTLSMGRGLHPKFERNDLHTLSVKYDVVNKLEMPSFKGLRNNDLSPNMKKKISAYNKRDVDAMVEIFDIMRRQMPQSEMELIDVTVRMFAAPVLMLDVSLAKREMRREIAERKALIMASNALDTANAAKVKTPLKKGEKLTDEKVLSSNKAFPQLLSFLGVTPPRKQSKTNPEKTTYALSKADEAFTDLIAHPDPKVVALVRGRLAAKSTIGETRAARLLRSGAKGMALPVYLNYCGAHTTRWSGGDKLNYQNLKKKGEIRRAIEAPKGYQLVVIDSSQIEVRGLAWLAGEEWLLEAFRKGDDPYCLFGSKVYGYTITKKDVAKRFIMKCCILGLGYQMGPPKLQVSILAQSINQGLDPVRLELDTCTEYVYAYRYTNKKITALWEFMLRDVIPTLIDGGSAVAEYKCLEYGREFIRLKGAIALHYPDARASKRTLSEPKGYVRRPASTVEKKARYGDATYRTPKGMSKIYGGLLTENVVQYLARMVVAEQMLKIAAKYRVVMMTHDEVVYLAKTKEVKEALDFGLKVMHTPPSWAPDLPVAAEGGYDSVYSK